MKSPKKKPAKASSELHVGDNVTVDDSPDIGVILEIDTTTKKAQVDFNGVKFRFALDRLTRAGEVKLKSTSVMDYLDFGAETRLDLRGMRAEAALREVDNFISTALRGSINFLTIIHGKGTGALRVAVQEFLKYHPSVVSYRNGELIEGGDGVTIVEL